MLQLRTFGGLSIESDGTPVSGAGQQRKTLALLALLAAAGERGMSRDRLIASLWPDTNAERGRGLLKQACYALRRDLRASDLFLGSIQLRLNPAAISSDVESFNSALESKDPAAAVTRYPAPFLDGFHLNAGGEFEAWAETERARLESRFQGALESLAEEATRRGDHRIAASLRRRVLDLDPLSSHAALTLMSALDDAGERAEALRCGQSHRELVRSELGATPSPELDAWVEARRQLTSVAVLPFVVLSDLADTRALSLGFADALITVFGNLEDVAVTPTAAIVNYTGGREPAQVCRELAVGHSLQGTVQKIGAHWRVSIQLFDAITQRFALSESHDFVMESAFEVQDEIARRAVISLQSRFPLAVPKSRERYSSDPAAYQEFMAGLRESASDCEATLRSAVEHLTRAVAIDPEFALAHATLAFVAVNLHYEFDPQQSWLLQAEDHCRRALALDPALPEAHLANAWILWSPAKNFQHAEAIAALEQVLAARPNFERAHNRLAGICLHIGRLPEARIAHERARRTNPKTRTGNLEWYYIFSGDFDRAEETAEEWFRERPGSRYAVATRVVPPLLAGNLDLAEERLAVALDQAPAEPWFMSFEGMLHARRGREDKALASIRRALDSPNSFGHAHHTWYGIACVHAVLGDTVTAMAWLERSVHTGFACWPFFRIDPFLENLRGFPAFERLTADLEQTYAGLPIQRL